MGRRDIPGFRGEGGESELSLKKAKPSDLTNALLRLVSFGTDEIKIDGYHIVQATSIEHSDNGDLQVSCKDSNGVGHLFSYRDYGNQGDDEDGGGAIEHRILDNK